MTSHDPMLPPPDAPAPPAEPRDVSPGAPAGLREAVAALMRDWTLEATQPKPEEVEALRTWLAPGACVYVSAPPLVHWQHLLDNALRVARAGFEPVPHVAVRNFSSREELREFLAGLGETGAVRRVLMIAGDRSVPLGPFASSLHGIQSGLLQEAGLQGVDIAGYPEGHARIPLGDLHKALRAKLYAARGAGLDARVVTQFSFDAKALLSWLLALRYEFPELPIRVGLAGPADAGTLLRYALRCGVRATARGLGRGLSLLGNLSADRTPLRLVRTLAEGWVLKRRGGVSLHFYAFGGTAKTAAWARAMADGALELNGREG